MSDSRAGKRKPAPGLVPGVTYSRGSMGETISGRAESIPIANWFSVNHMNGLCNGMLSIAALLAVFIAFHWVSGAGIFGVHRVFVSKPVKQVDEAVLVNTMRSLRGGFLSADLAEARDKIGSLSWVRRVDVRREFPDRLNFVIEEHEPLARWGHAALINSYGEVFEADYDGALPEFSGPRGSEGEVLDFYGRSKSALAALGLSPVAIELSPRRAWRLTLDNGLVLELGRDRSDDRLAVFIRAYRAAFARLPAAKGTVDLRYDGGFVVKKGLGRGLVKKESVQGNKG
ncbi:MAG: cell division protein FtsQ/DivIB [Pseudomonadota bacterium]|nr:cell division protein FtsQ/DivIB [Pseudomonadota bacterium]